MQRVNAVVLRGNVAAMMAAAGMDAGKSEVVADVLVEADSSWALRGLIHSWNAACRAGNFIKFEKL